MRPLSRPLGALAVAVFLASACTPLAPAQRPPADEKRRAVRTGASAAPAARGLAAALRKPPGATLPLQGTVRLDAGYLVAAGAGNILSHNGSQIVAAGGLNLIGADAATLVGPDGASLVGPDGASLIGADGGSLVGPDGATLVAAGAGNIVAAGGLNAAERTAPLDASGNLVAAGGLNLIGADGASLVGADGASFKLAQAPTSAPTPAQATASGQGAGAAAGAQLPAAGLLVSVVRLGDRAYLPLGVDAGGEPVYAVYSNARGGYEVWIPEHERGNVAVVASVPGKADPRFHLNRLVEPTLAKDEAVDEGAALTARYLRLGLTRKLAFCMQSPALMRTFLAAEVAFVGAPGPGGNEAAVVPGSPYWRVGEMLTRLGVLAREAGIPDDAPAAVWEEAAQRAVDACVGRIPLSELMIRSDYIVGWPAGQPPRPVMSVLEEVTAVMLEGAGRKLQAEPGFFSQAFLADTINGPVHGVESPAIGDWTGRIRKASDVAEFSLIEYFGAVRVNTAEPMRRLYRVFYSALGEREPAVGTKAAEAVNMGRSAGYTLLVTVAHRMQGPEIGADGRPVSPDLALEAELRARFSEVAQGPRP